MYGLQAITAHNGWAMAIAGACIVFSGLLVLSLVIAQLHKILNLIEYKREKGPSQTDAKTPVESGPPSALLTDLSALTAAFQPLAEELGETFQLADLYELALREKLPHPHLSIKALREAQILSFQGEGLFKWISGATF